MHNEYILMKMGKKRKQENSKQVQNLALWMLNKIDSHAK
jgi:hypothetical protein